MSTRREGLRPLQPKYVPPRKTNAEHCKEYQKRVKADPDRLKVFKQSKQAAQSKWVANRSDDQKEKDKENARRRQQEKRNRDRENKAKDKSSKTLAPAAKTLKPETRAERLKKEQKREAAKLRQRQRRAKFTPQKKAAEREKQRLRYHHRKHLKRAQKSSLTSVTTPGTVRRKGYYQFLKEAYQMFKTRRNKTALLKMSFIKGCLNKKVDALDQERHFYQRQQRIDRKVEDFYQKKAINLPAKNMSTQSMTPKKVLTKRIEDLFKDFKAEYPGYKISLRTFSRRRPDNILLAGSRAFLQCLCEFCTNPMLKVKKLNPHLTNKVKNVEALVDLTLCKKDEESRECVERQCGSCGVYSVIEDFKKEVKDLEEEISWLRWEKTALSNKDQVEKKGTVGQMIDELETEMQNLALHVKTAKWQRQQYQKITEDVPEGCAVVTLDYAENYKCRFQNEIQSAHWSYRQVTLHTAVMHYRCPEDECNTIVKDYIVHLSDDLKHDAAFSKAVMDDVFEYLEGRGLLRAIVFSDGCPAQYKSRLPFLHLTDLDKDHPDMTIERHFFGSHHGKSLCDSCGGTIKKMATVAVASGNVVIQSASDYFQFCQQLVLPKPGAKETENRGNDKPNCCHVKRSFIKIDTKDLDRSTTSESLKTMAGSRKLHALKLTGEKGIVLHKKLSCFCASCLSQVSGGQNCQKRMYTGQWTNGSLLGKDQKKKKTGRKSLSVTPTCPPQPYVENFSPASASPIPDPESRGFEKEMSRNDFFLETQVAFEKATTFEEVQELCFQIKDIVSEWPMISEPSEEITLDIVASSQLPEQYATKYVPVAVSGDGNCFFRSISYLVTGCQDHHIEYRVRVLLEMVTNQDKYTDKKFLKEAASEEGDDILMLLTLFSANPIDDELSIEDIFRSEVMAIKNRTVYCSPWEFLVAANVMQQRLLSVYPNMGEYCQLMNRVFKPAGTEPVSTQALMWTSSRRDMVPEYWLANHVVPLLEIDVGTNSSQCGLSGANPEPPGHDQASPEPPGHDQASPEPPGHDQASPEPPGHDQASPEPPGHDQASPEPPGHDQASPEPPGHDQASPEPPGHDQASPEPPGHSQESPGVGTKQSCQLTSACRLVNIEEFYPVTWFNKKYICQVKALETVGGVKMAEVHFMKEAKGGLFTFSNRPDGQPDTSWEPLSIFEESPVQLELNGELSTQRKQFYEIR